MARRKVIKFPKEPVRKPIAVRGGKMATPEQRLAEAVDALLLRDGAEATFHNLAELNEKIRRHLVKALAKRA